MGRERQIQSRRGGKNRQPQRQRVKVAQREREGERERERESVRSDMKRISRI